MCRRRAAELAMQQCAGETLQVIFIWLQSFRVAGSERLRKADERMHEAVYQACEGVEPAHAEEGIIWKIRRRVQTTPLIHPRRHHFLRRRPRPRFARRAPPLSTTAMAAPRASCKRSASETADDGSHEPGQATKTNPAETKTTASARTTTATGTKRSAEDLADGGSQTTDGKYDGCTATSIGRASE